ncbi:hypothetical protein PTKIN_Ptkin15bG0155300 [Pterospermum kingtungense]
MRFPVFTIDGFDNWKRVGGNQCVFNDHEGENKSYSPHGVNVQKWKQLEDPSQHIDNVMRVRSSQQVSDNRLRLKTSIEMVRWLGKQAFTFRGHDESGSSSNRGNFLEMVNFLATMNKDINKVYLDNAPGNSKYTSTDIQKEILKILANEGRKKIREEIGSAKFCILVDEALDESNQEQMAIILRFVDCHGII